MNDMDRDPRESDFSEVEAQTAGEIIQQHRGALARTPSIVGDMSVVASEGLFGKVVTAQRVAVERDERKVMMRLKTLAAMAGESYYYRWSVNSKDGKKWVEGCSIKLANDLARLYGNCSVDIRAFDQGDSWIFYSRFLDLETGYSLTRAYQQRKDQETIKTRDRQRALDMVFQIGQSKAMRNVIVNALQTFADFAFDEARNGVVEKVGKDLPGYRTRIAARLAELKVDHRRVEAMIGRPIDKWLAPDAARVIAEIQSVTDGMADAEDLWPSDLERPSRETKTDAPKEVEKPKSKETAKPQPGKEAMPDTAGTSEPDKATPPATKSEPGAASQAQPQAQPEAESEEPPPIPAEAEEPASEAPAQTAKATEPVVLPPSAAGSPMPKVPKAIANKAEAEQWHKWTNEQIDIIHTLTGPRQKEISQRLEKYAKSFDWLAKDWPAQWQRIEAAIDWAKKHGA